MRWLDIDLRRGGDEAVVRRFLERARARRDALADIQKASGLDSPQVLSCLEEIGQLLFRAARAADEAAFAPDRTDGVTRAPAPLGATTEQDAPGYHLIVDRALLDLPWTALHNGIHFLLEQAPICASTHGSRPAAELETLPAWLRRWEADAFTETALGPASVSELIRRFRPEACAEPAILFLDGQGGDDGSVHGRRERDMVGGALETRSDGQRLARLETPPGVFTPAVLASTAHGYQAFHFSGATAVAPSIPDRTVDNLDLADAPSASDVLLEDPTEFEVVGVDPITSLLDQINEKADAGRLAPWSQPGTAQAVAESAPCWQLEDGPVRPEDLARRQAAPPLVFSHSYLGLQALGARFLAPGTSVFVGPPLAVTPDQAREFAAA
ncbi:hypothetical protein H8E07_15370, partial [bacterium]|nr:hypothetical protein [bacterium]